MNHCPNRGAVGSITIVPPFPKFAIGILLLFLGLQSSFAQEPSEVRGNITDTQLEFLPNSLELTDPGLTVSLAQHARLYFKDNENEALLVKIRTRHTERFHDGPDGLRNLQEVRAAVFKSLLLADGGLEMDQLQVHLSIVYDNSPPTVAFEIHPRHAKAFLDSMDVEAATAGTGN
jgi:hypothetical protein